MYDNKTVCVTEASRRRGIFLVPKKEKTKKKNKIGIKMLESDEDYPSSIYDIKLSIRYLSTQKRKSYFFSITNKLHFFVLHVTGGEGHTRDRNPMNLYSTRFQ